MKALFRQHRYYPISCPPAHRQLPRVYFDFQINDTPLGRVIFELYDNVSPKTVTNFIEIANGKVIDGQKLHYENTPITKILPFRGIWGGVFGKSIYGKSFPDENYAIRHNRAGLLTTASQGINLNDGGFIITLGPSEWLDNRSVVFGEVISGMQHLSAIEKLGGINGLPRKNIVIKNSGSLEQKDYHKYDQEPYFDVWATHH